MRTTWMALTATLVACGGGPVGDGDGVLDGDEVPAVGWTAELVGTAHDVAGTATITDEQTIELTDFTFDGGGLNARFFLLVDGEDFHRDLELSDNLVGTAFDAESLTLDLPAGTSFTDFNLLTFWCIPAGVSFGTGVFEPPAE
jgi:hypothetical protein